MSVRAILSSVVLVILIALSSTKADESTLLDGLREVEESFIKILGQSSHVLSFARFTHKSHPLYYHWYGKMYQHAEEIKHRFSVFKDNLDLIRSTNKKGLSYKLGVNKFADLTKQEFQRNKIGAARFATLKGSHNLTERALLETTAPTAKDWREDGIVSPVRDEGQCNAGWAISAVGAVEAAYRQKNAIGIYLSEQQLLDCSTGEGNHGCNGGRPDYAFTYSKKHGLGLGAIYPYVGRQGICRDTLTPPSVYVKGYVTVKPDEGALKLSVGSTGPIIIALEVTDSFHLYKSGVYTSSDCTNLLPNHFMLAVGYGIEDRVPYWLIQNSWGVDWGEKGYVKVEMGKNMCGVASDAFYPFL